MKTKRENVLKMWAAEQLLLQQPIFFPKYVVFPVPTYVRVKSSHKEVRVRQILKVIF